MAMRSDNLVAWSWPTAAASSFTTSVGRAASSGRHAPVGRGADGPVGGVRLGVRLRSGARRPRRGASSTTSSKSQTSSRASAGGRPRTGDPAWAPLAPGRLGRRLVEDPGAFAGHTPPSTQAPGPAAAASGLEGFRRGDAGPALHRAVARGRARRGPAVAGRSPVGRCRSSGTSFGTGGAAGRPVGRPLARAVRRGRPVRADVVRGTGCGGTAGGGRRWSDDRSRTGGGSGVGRETGGPPGAAVTRGPGRGRGPGGAGRRPARSGRAGGVRPVGRRGAPGTRRTAPDADGGDCSARARRGPVPSRRPGAGGAEPRTADRGLVAGAARVGRARRARGTA